MLENCSFKKSFSIQDVSNIKFQDNEYNKLRFKFAKDNYWDWARTIYFKQSQILINVNAKQRAEID